MAVWTVLTPPAAPRRALEEAALVPEDFARWAAILGPLGFIWFLFHRLWLAALIGLALAVAVALVGRWLGFSAGSHVLAQILLAGFVGYEANEARRATLLARGWRDHGPVAGADRAEAERRFLDGFLAKGAEPAAPAPAEYLAPRRADPGAGGVTGLFPTAGGTG